MRARKKDREPTIQESKREAAQQQLGNESKLDVAHQAVLVEDARELAKQDRDNVREYQDRLFKRRPRNGEQMGHLIVGEDVRVNSGNSWLGLVATALVTALLAAGSAFVYFKAMEPPTPSPDPVVAPVVQPWQFRLTFKADDGTQVNVQPLEGEGSNPPPAVDTDTDVTFPQ